MVEISVVSLAGINKCLGHCERDEMIWWVERGFITKTRNLELHEHYVLLSIELVTIVGGSYILEGLIWFTKLIKADKDTHKRNNIDS